MCITRDGVGQVRLILILVNLESPLTLTHEHRQSARNFSLMEMEHCLVGLTNHTHVLILFHLSSGFVCCTGTSTSLWSYGNETPTRDAAIGVPGTKYSGIHFRTALLDTIPRIGKWRIFP